MSNSPLFKAPEEPAAPVQTFEQEKAAVMEKIMANASAPDEPLEDGPEPEPVAEAAPVAAPVEPATAQQPPAPEPDNPARFSDEQIDEISMGRVRSKGNVVLTPEELAAKIMEAKGPQQPQAPADPLSQVPQVQMPPEAANWDYDTQVRYMANEMMKQVVPGMIQEAVTGAVQQVEAKYAPTQQFIQQQQNYMAMGNAARKLAEEAGDAEASEDVFKYLLGLEREDPNIIPQIDQSPVVLKMVKMQVKNIVDSKVAAKVDKQEQPIPPSDAVSQSPEPVAEGSFKVDRKRAAKSELGAMGVDLGEFEKKVNKALKEIG